MTGLWPKRNEPAIRNLPGGRFIRVQSDLDYLVVRGDGRCGCVDLKSFEGSYFTRSKLSESQIRLCEQYAQRNVPSGMIVLLRGLSQVYFYDAKCISTLPNRSRLDHKTGMYLGPELCFDPSAIFKD